MTRVVQVDPHNLDEALIQEAADLLRAGRLVAFPTETVYGLGANGFDAFAVERIFAAKGRPHSDPLILHLWDASELARVVDSSYFDVALAERLKTLAHFWPGPLTLVLPRDKAVPAVVTAGGENVAVRVPAHPVARALIKAAGVPIAAPSANRFMRPSPTRAVHVLEDLEGQVDLVLDAGETSIGVESTVLSLVDFPPVLLRPGGVGLEGLEAVLGEVLLPGEAVEVRGAVASPGLLSKHYAPRAELLLVPAERANSATLRDLARSVSGRGMHLGLLLPDEDLLALGGFVAERFSLGSLLHPETIATRLFAGLRDLDRRGVGAILARGFAPEGIGRALNDRLLRAAGGKIVP